jgi:osmotically inducible protein OsmC
MAGRNGSAQWNGDLQGGNGTLKVGDGVFEGPYSFKSRFEEGDGTNPEQLIAAAHAGCFTMALAAALGADGHAPEALSTSANVELRFVDELPTITRIDLVTEGTVPGLDAEQFESYAEKAKTGCVVSRALAGVDEITLQATLS